MGEVWLAEQTQPVRRQVALKVIKAGMDTAHVVARFEAERQALAVMDHPAIAKVFDAGTTPEGRPYFVMEYVPGEAITGYCRRHRLSTRGRLDLFLQVCDGVHHAHQKGIIHRDLKPSNILVTLLDTRPVPKIIDFGVAKAIAQPLTQRTLYTELGTLVGTLEYMSPEQAEMTGLDIDTRTDVYALGVILYELLTGVLPFDTKRLREEGISEIRRVIREEEPVRPSTRLRSAALTSTSQATAVVAQARELRGDLDWITMHALEKDRARRYGSSAEFAADVRRHLNHLPVLASPPSAVYRMSKFVRRHRVGVGVAATVMTLLAVLAVTTSIEARRVAVERDRANLEAEAAKAVNDFIQNDLLAQASASNQARPDNKPDPDLKVRTALDRAAERIAGKFNKQPSVEAAVQLTIGKTYGDLGLYTQAEKHLERALEIRRRVLGEEHVGVLDTMDVLGTLYVKEAKYEQAEQLLTKALQMSRRTAGEQHPQTLTAMNSLGRLHMMQGKLSEAEPLYVSALDGRRRVLGEQHRDTLESMDGLASLYWREGKYAQAEPVRANVLELQRRILGDEHPDTLTSMNNLALLFSYQGKYVQAETLFTQVIEIMRRVLGEKHIETMISIGNLGIVYFRQGRHSDAEGQFRKALELKREALGEQHPETLTSMNNLAVLYRAEGKYVLAESLYRKVVELQRPVLGDEHPNMLLTMNGLAFLYVLQGKRAQAEEIYKKSLETQRRVVGQDHPDTVSTMFNLAGLYLNEGKNAEAEPLSTKVVDIRRRTLGEQDPATMRSVAILGLLYLNLHRYDQAESLLRSAMKRYEQTDGDSWERYDCQSMLGDSLASQRRFVEAEPLLLSAYEGLKKREAAIPQQTSRPPLERAEEWVVRLYKEWGKPDKAVEWQIKFRRRTGSGDLPRTLSQVSK